jgi:hypothetical protein
LSAGPHIVARAIGFNPDGAEVVSASSWSMDENELTVATPSNSERNYAVFTLRGRTDTDRPLSNVASLQQVFKTVDYPVRGFAFHALATPEAWDAMRSHYAQQLHQEIAAGKRVAALVHAGMLVHFIVDSYVHPEEPLLGHLLEGHDLDYAIRKPREFIAATEVALLVQQTERCQSGRLA